MALENDFDTDVNYSLHQNQLDSQSSVVSTIYGGAVATVADIGASIWNSLPFTPEVDTEELLGRISGDALRVYQEHPDAVHTASLIGGSLIPAGLAVKGMNALRNGSKAVNWFTKVGKEADLSAARTLFENGKAATTEYRNLKRSIFVKSALNQAVDAVAGEAAILGLMNAHPMMEDYLEEPVKNFAIGAAFGGAIGGVAGIIADNFALKQAVGAIEEAAIGAVSKEIRAVVPTMTDATAMQTAEINVKNLDNLINSRKALGKTAEDDLTYSYAAKVQSIERQRVESIFQGMASDDLKALPRKSLEAIKKTVSEDNAFWGVEKIKFAPAEKVEAIIKAAPKTPLSELPSLSAFKKAPSSKELVEKGKEAVYFQDLKLFGNIEDLKHYAGASALGLSPEALVKSIGKNFGKVANEDFALASVAKSAPQAEAEYAAWQIFVDKMEPEKFTEWLAGAKIAKEDTAALSAIESKLDAILTPAWSSTFTLKLGNKVETMAGLRQQIVDNKYGEIKNLIKKGVPAASIAKRTNTPADTVEQIMTFAREKEEYASIARNHPLKAFQTAEDARNSLKAENRPLVVSGNLQKRAYGKNHAALNDRAVSNINNELVDSILRGSGSSAANELAVTIFETNKYALDIVKSQLAKGNNEYAGARFWNSFDFFTRNMGDIGPVFSQVGKSVQHVANNLITKVVQPISMAMETVAKDPIALTEFNTFKNVNDSLKGYRTFRNGQLFQRAEKTDIQGKPVIVEEPVLFQGSPLKIQTPAVVKLIETIQENSKELYNLANTGRKIKGQANISDIGLWIPAFNPVNKFIAYVHNTAEDTTQLLWGKTAAELEDSIKTFTTQIKQDPSVRIIRKSDQAEWSMLNGRLDPIHMSRADLGLQKTGAGASAIPKLTTEVLTEIAGGYEHYINAQVRNLADLSMSDMTDMLQKMSAINQRNFEGQPLSAVQKVVAAPKDAALSLRNALLGNPALGEYEGWKSLNKSFETGIKMGTDALQSVWHSAIAPLASKKLGGKKTISPENIKDLDYESFVKKLEEKGVANPFALFDQTLAKEKYNVARMEDAPDVSKRIVYASNALAATALLRFGDLAQPLVNIMSMPIMGSLAITARMPDTFLGVQKATANVSGVQIMHEGVRMAASDLFKARNARWEELGYFSPIVSEVNEIQRASRKFEKGATATIENALDSKLVHLMSRPADYAESMSRRVAMNTGAALAKRLYPELDENGITIFARDFMDKAIGNFHAAQRPVFFQGTLGVAMGLFQTYMVTMAQNVYRHLELRDYKNLLKASLLQSTIFGAKSMPGFDQISQAIGEHYSDENIDLTTGTYRATGDTLADFILYGLPSNLGPSFYSRGDIDPRLPNLLAGAENMVAVNFVSQVTQAVGTVAEALQQQPGQMGQALAQAISLQNMSRPLARTAELATGFSVTREGNTVQVPEEVWTPTGIISRILATRPLEEAKVREAQHLNTFYGSVDREARQKVVNQLRTGLRNGTLTDGQTAEYMEEYLRKGGSPTGWISAVNTAIGKTETSGKEILAEKLTKEDSPLAFMIRQF